jgi:hypothetical protein
MMGKAVSYETLIANKEFSMKKRCCVFAALFSVLWAVSSIPAQSPLSDWTPISDFDLGIGGQAL